MNIWISMRAHAAAVFWVVALGIAFIYAWRAGHLMRLADYVRETRAELEKCTWPTWAELKGSTAVVMISLALLGGFTMISDWAFSMILGWVTTLTT